MVLQRVCLKNPFRNSGLVLPFSHMGAFAERFEAGVGVGFLQPVKRQGGNGRRAGLLGKPLEERVRYHADHAVVADGVDHPVGAGMYGLESKVYVLGQGAVHVMDEPVLEAAINGPPRPASKVHAKAFAEAAPALQLQGSHRLDGEKQSVLNGGLFLATAHGAQHRSGNRRARACLKTSAGSARRNPAPQCGGRGRRWQSGLCG